MPLCPGGCGVASSLGLAPHPQVLGVLVAHGSQLSCTQGQSFSQRDPTNSDLLMGAERHVSQLQMGTAAAGQGSVATMTPSLCPVLFDLQRC